MMLSVLFRSEAIVWRYSSKYTLTRNNSWGHENRPPINFLLSFWQHTNLLAFPLLFRTREWMFCWKYDKVFQSSSLCESARIQGFWCPYFPKFRLNTEIYSINLRIQTKSGKMRTRKTPNMDTWKTAVKICLKFYYWKSWPGTSRKHKTGG